MQNYQYLIFSFVKLIKLLLYSLINSKRCWEIIDIYFEWLCFMFVMCFRFTDRTYKHMLRTLTIEANNIQRFSIMQSSFFALCISYFVYLRLYLFLHVDFLIISMIDIKIFLRVPVQILSKFNDILIVIIIWYFYIIYFSDETMN